MPCRKGSVKAELWSPVPQWVSTDSTANESGSRRVRRLFLSLVSKMVASHSPEEKKKLTCAPATPVGKDCYEFEKLRANGGPENSRSWLLARGR